MQSSQFGLHLKWRNKIIILCFIHTLYPLNRVYASLHYNHELPALAGIFGFVEKVLVYFITITTLVPFMPSSFTTQKNHAKLFYQNSTLIVVSKYLKFPLKWAKESTCTAFRYVVLCFHLFLVLHLPWKQSHQFLPLICLFLYFPVSHFTMNCRLCQLLALCLKCHCPETWTGFQTFFECQHSNQYKKEQPKITLWMFSSNNYPSKNVSIQIQVKKNDQTLFSEQWEE